VKPTAKAQPDPIQEVFERMGGTDRMLLWAKLNPTDFYRLYAQRKS
jgi:hypothetical protein